MRNLLVAIGLLKSKTAQPPAICANCEFCVKGGVYLQCRAFQSLPARIDYVTGEIKPADLDYCEIHNSRGQCKRYQERTSTQAWHVDVPIL